MMQYSIYDIKNYNFDLQYNTQFHFYAPLSRFNINAISLIAFYTCYMGKLFSGVIWA